MASSRWRARLLAVALGLLAALSQPPLSWPLVLVVALPALFWLWHRAISPARSFWIGWFAGAGYFGASLIWIAEPFLVRPDLHGWLIPFAVTGLAGGMALFWGAGFWIGKRLGSGRWAAPDALTFGWTGLEWLRGNILSGFPWSLLGYAWTETSAIQLAASVGIYGVTLWTILSGAILGSLAIHSTARTRLAAGLLATLLIAGPFLSGWYRLSAIAAAPNAEAPQERLPIALVQPNVAQRDKWQPALRESHLADLLAKTREGAEAGARIVIWPEAATPYQLDRAPQLRALIADALGSDATLLAGAIRFEGEDAFNSLVAIGAGGAILDTYDKQHLVPFGEMLPFAEFLARIGVTTMIALPGGFVPGQARERLMEIGDLPRLVPMICYETIFPAEIMDRSTEAEWMVQATNDAWFGEWIGPYQHFAMARVRAVERGLPLARAANTGISALVDGYGRIDASLPLNRDGVLVGSMPVEAPPTLYRRFEDIPFAVLMAGLLAIALAGRSRRFPSREGTTPSN